MTVKSILMVCRGNICRSPMAEGFFGHKLNSIQSSIIVSSAGISALVDYSADLNAQSVMHQQGIDISKHRARQLTDSLVRTSDLILVMSVSQLTEVTRKYPIAKGKTFLLGHWQDVEIKDPYQQPQAAFEKVYQHVECAWQDWKTRIL